MKANSLIPTSLREAAKRIREALPLVPGSLDHFQFVRAWFAIPYVYPGFHPDSGDFPDSVLPAHLMPLTSEAWRRAEAGELPDDLLYPSDAQWAGLYDRMENPSAEEAERRKEIHLRYPAPAVS